MSRAKQDAPSDLPSGEIRFYDNYEAPLEAGDYTIAVTQHVQNAPGGLAPNGEALDQDIPAGGPLEQLFTVVAPRFKLDPADVQSTFPPDSSSGTFDQNLPHIVLTKRGLPWERFLVEGNKTTPWLAVLLFSPDEIVPPADSPNVNPLANPSRAGTYYLSEVINPPAGTLGPKVVPESEDLLGRVTALRVTQGGSGYTSAPGVSIKGDGSPGATATATVQGGAVTSLTLDKPGSGYTSDPTVSFEGGGGSGATAQALRGLLCRAIDVPTTVFTRLTPRFTTGGQNPFDELQYLAHVRRVNTGDKELQATKDDGWFSVVIGNRFPSPGAGPVLSLTLDEAGENYTSAPDVAFTGGGGSGASAVAKTEDGVIVSLTLTGGGSGYASPPAVSFSGGGGGGGASATAQIGAPWIAHLVTLEGFADYLTDNPVWPQDARTGRAVERVRLVSLYSWNFTCLSETGDFRDLMLNLIGGQTKGGSGLLLRLPVPADEQAPSDATAAARKALDGGYTALRYDTLVGDHTFAWYRGPLLPAPRPLFKNTPPYASSSAAMIYDQTAGLFDQSYAAAWQTGRLLALSDASFGTKLLEWRRTGTKRVNLLLERLNSPKLKALAGTPDLGDDSAATQLHALLKPALLSEALEGRLAGSFSQNVASRLARSDLPARSPGEVTRLRGAPAPTPNHVSAIKELHAQPAVKRLLSELNEQELNDPDSPLSYVRKWLADLCLLYGVPFINLVPHARMLPPESLRFFYVDPNYLEALIDGALSIGLQSSRDSLYQTMSRPVLRAGIEKGLPAVRALRAGRATAATAPPAADPLPTPSQTMAGLLLRSAVVSGWPGLEVRGYSDASGTAPLKPLRIDRLAPDVLLCLFPEAPARVEISEPKEGLAFGHEDDFIVDLRWVTNNPPKQPIGGIIPGRTVTINNYFRNPGPGPVLRVKDWQPFLNTQLNAAYGNGNVKLGPAGFAIQMVRAPEEFVLNNTPPAGPAANGPTERTES